MKKTIISLLLLLSIAAGVFAQGYDVVEAGEEFDYKTDEVYLTVGTPSAVQVLGAAFLVIFSLGTVDLEKQGSSVPVSFTAGYNHYF